MSKSIEKLTEFLGNYIEHQLPEDNMDDTMQVLVHDGIKEFEEANDVDVTVVSKKIRGFRATVTVTGEGVTEYEARANLDYGVSELDRRLDCGEDVVDVEVKPCELEE